MMDNNEKTKILNDFEWLIKKKCFAYKINGFTKEELIQEVKTYICLQLDKFSKRKGSLPSYVSMSINNKLNNLYKSPYNRKEVLKPKIYQDEEEVYGLHEKIALEVAFDLLRNHEHKELIADRIKGWTYRELGDKYGVSHQTARNIFDRFVELVKEEL